MAHRDTCRREALGWLEQAKSDVRVARALIEHTQLSPGDVACHATALCAQALEKAIKSYAWVLGERPRMTHKAYVILDTWLERGRERLRYPDHFSHLSRMFGLEARERLREILDLTPGATGNSEAPNTEYPWHDPASGELCVPATALFFECSPEDLRDELHFVESVVGLFEKLARAAERGRL